MDIKAEPAKCEHNWAKADWRNSQPHADEWCTRCGTIRHWDWCLEMGRDDARPKWRYRRPSAKLTRLDTDEVGLFLIYLVWSFQVGERRKTTLHGFFTSKPWAKKIAKAHRDCYGDGLTRTYIETRQLDHAFCQGFKI